MMVVAKIIDSDRFALGYIFDCLLNSIYCGYDLAVCLHSWFGCRCKLRAE